MQKTKFLLLSILILTVLISILTSLPTSYAQSENVADIIADTINEIADDKEGPSEFMDDLNLKIKDVIVDVDIGGVVHVSNPENTKNLRIFLNYYPREDQRQSIIVQEFFPINNFQGYEDNLAYFDFDVVYSETEYGLYTQLKTEHKIVEVNKKIDFPIEDVPEELLDYVFPSTTVDSDNTRVMELAQSIAEGEDDLYKVVAKAAAWVVENIAYDPNLTMIEFETRSSWIMRNRKGACREQTNLLLGILRALGIPARFVSGIAYTNSILFDTEWGAHAWAEVWFPDVGWVPFDVTYQQFSFVDASHIKLRNSIDSTDDTVRYKWRESGSEVEIDPLQTNTRLVSKSGEVKDIISMSINTFYKQIGLGSYNLVEVEVKNNMKSYLAPYLVLSNVQDIELTGMNAKVVILEPLETKKVYWIVKAGDAFEKSYSYTIPISVNSNLNARAENEFVISNRHDTHTLGEIEEIASSYEEDKALNPLKDVDLGCQIIGEQEIYVNSIAEIECSIDNLGESVFKDIELCLDDECRKYNLDPNQKQKANFKKKVTNLNKYFILKTFYEDFKKNYMFFITVLDKPSLEITNFNYAPEVSFLEEFGLEFTLKKTSKAVPEDIKVEIELPYYTKHIEIQDFDLQKDLVLRMIGSNLDMGNNTIVIKVMYKDKDGKTYVEEEQVVIELIDLTLKQKVQIYFRNFYFWLDNIF